MNQGATPVWTDRRSPPITDPGASSGAGTWLKIAPAGFCWFLREATAGEESRSKGGDKTKIHELIVGEHLSKQWGEPQYAGTTTRMT